MDIICIIVIGFGGLFFIGWRAEKEWQFLFVGLMLSIMAAIGFILLYNLEPQIIKETNISNNLKISGREIKFDHPVKINEMTLDYLWSVLRDRTWYEISPYTGEHNEDQGNK